VKNTPFVLAVLLGLCGVSAQTVFSPTSALYQLLFLGAGIILYVVITKKIAPDTVVHTSALLSIIGIVVLAALLVFGDPVRGSRRWFPFFGFSLQPSVIFIPFFILTLSLWVNRYRPSESWGNYVKVLLLCSVPSAFVFAQPDLGTSMLIALTGFFLIVYSGIKLWQFIVIALIPLPGVFFAERLLKPYQLARLTSFLNPALDPLGINYNSLQSVIAIGSGGFLGKGLFRTSQSRLNFLPEAHTDFIFASWTEAFGFVGAFFLICLFSWFLYSLLKEALEEKNPLHQLYCAGFCIYLFLETAINIGMNLRLLPVVGVPFPLISYGGSAILTVFIGLAIQKKLREL